MTVRADSTTIHVLFAINDDFSQHCAVTIASMAATAPECKFDIAIMYIRLSQENIDKLSGMTGTFPNVAIRFVEFDAAQVESLPKHNIYPADVYMRFWIGEIFDESVERALYLDADLVIRSSIRPLWETDLADHEVIAAVEIFGADVHHRANIPTDSPYFNSGVILFDLVKWRSENFVEQLMAFLDEHGDKVKNLDQDSLNGVLHRRWHQLDLSWNAISPYFRAQDPQGLGKARQKELRRITKIAHFNGPGKPWFVAVRHPFKHLYWKYLAMTPWSDFKAPDNTLAGWTKYYLGPILQALPFSKASRRARANRAK